MTVGARQVLADCEIVLEMLESEDNLKRWRVHWVGALALLRAVGHVLVKVDGEDKERRRVIDAAYRRWKTSRGTHAIFWEFIEEERNNVLKEYQFNLHPMEDVNVVVVASVRHPKTGEVAQIPQVIPIGENIYRPILGGFSEGNDARDVYREALDWWNKQLTEIESELGMSGRSKSV